MFRLPMVYFLMGLMQETSALEGNQLLFTVIGETTRESGYAHLVIPLPIPELGNSIDVLNDLIKTYIQVHDETQQHVSKDGKLRN